MTDHSELKRLAETATQGEWGFSGSNIAPLRREKDGAGYVEIWRSVAQAYNPDNAKFIAKANPAAVLALIAEVEGLRAQHGRDSAELRSLCQARDDARKDRDQLKEEVERSTEREIMQLAEIEAMRRDAERYRFLRQDISNNVQDFCIVKKRWSATFPDRILELDGADAEIDAAMTKGDQPWKTQ